MVLLEGPTVPLVPLVPLCRSRDPGDVHLNSSMPKSASRASVVLFARKDCSAWPSLAVFFLGPSCRKVGSVIPKPCIYTTIVSLNSNGRSICLLCECHIDPDWFLLFKLYGLIALISSLFWDVSGEPATSIIVQSNHHGLDQ